LAFHSNNECKASEVNHRDSSVSKDRLHRNDSRREWVIPGESFDLALRHAQVKLGICSGQAYEGRSEEKFVERFMRIIPYGSFAKIPLIVDELVV
jgi:hypothetical protein